MSPETIWAMAPVSGGREDAERFIEEVRGDDPEKDKAAERVPGPLNLLAR